jgi:hypothetical protein
MVYVNRKIMGESQPAMMFHELWKSFRDKGGKKNIKRE